MLYTTNCKMCGGKMPIQPETQPQYIEHIQPKKIIENQLSKSDIKKLL